MNSVLTLADYPKHMREAPPEALTACYVCGRRRLVREPDSDWITDGAWYPSGPRRAGRDEAGYPIEEYLDQPWRTRHAECEPTAVGVVRALLDVETTDVIARAAVAEAGIAGAWTTGKTSTRAWAHVSREQRRVLRGHVAAATATPVPQRHREGRCTWCGRSRSVTWFESSFRWPDGTGALCDTCRPILDVIDMTSESELRRAGLCLLADVFLARTYTNSYGLQFACERVPEEHRYEDNHQPWTYSPRLAEVRQMARESEPVNIRDDLEREIAVKIDRARRERARRAQEAAEAPPEPPAILW